MAIKFVYFDIGKIFHTSDKVFSTAAEKFGISMEGMVEIYWDLADELTTGKIKTDEFWKICCQKLGAKNGWESYDFAKSWVGDYEIIPEMHEFAKRVAAKYRIGIISNHFLGLPAEALKQGKIPDLNYEVFINSAEVGVRKPDPKIFEIAEKRCGVEPPDILFIDDQMKNLAVAKERGWQTWQFNYLNPEYPDLGV